MTRDGKAAPFIFMIAGEPSGDALGGALIAALRERAGGGIRFAGIGGESMAEQGLSSLVPLSDLAVAGIAEVLPRAPLILRRTAPVAVFWTPIWLLSSALRPVAVLPWPVVLPWSALCPVAVLMPPVSLKVSALTPVAVLAVPLVLLLSALAPVAVFWVPVVLK